MQVLKDYTRENILKVAGQIFLRKGFAKTSMRNIAKGAGVGLSNLYNYFGGKDEIFRCVVSPLVKEMDRMIYEHHDVAYAERFLGYVNGDSDEMLAEQTNEYLMLTRRYRQQMELLFFKAQGSSLQNFLDEYTDRCTQQVLGFMEAFEQKYPDKIIQCHPFTYHLHTVWMFDMFCEIIKHKLPPEVVKDVVADYIKFEYTGWRELIKR